ncbi:hypothetical protein [Spiroplasma endosymbiont of Nebria brevicollis]|uniref:hypothetical protein n=1 Tax=Spiroplasma endosymbiont of Nebria brevicollis TaxID=3066284 RepID=UPI00313CAF94
MDKKQENMNKESEERKKFLHKLKQQNRKIDLLAADCERQSEKIKSLQNSQPSTSKHKSSKSPKM